MQDIHDIRGPIEILTLWQQTIPYILVALGVILISALIYYFIRKRKSQSSNVLEKTIQLSPYETALKELDGARKLMIPGEDKALAIVLSMAIRNYLEEEYHLPAPEKTTEEFLNDMRRTPHFQGYTLKLLENFLKMCDLAKFAKKKLSTVEQEAVYKSAYEFVQSTHDLKVKTENLERVVNV